MIAAQLLVLFGLLTTDGDPSDYYWRMVDARDAVAQGRVEAGLEEARAAAEEARADGVPSWFQGELDAFVRIAERAASPDPDVRADWVEITKLRTLIRDGWNGGDATEGVAYAERRLELLVEHLDEDDELVFDAREELATNLRRAGRNREAVELAEELLVGADPDKLSRPHLIAQASTTIGRALAEMRRLDEAAGHLLRAHDIWSSLDPAALGQTIWVGDYGAVVDGLANVREYQQRFEEALVLRRELLDVLERGYGRENRSYITGLNNLGLYYHRRREFAKALPIWRECLAMKLRYLEPGDSSIGTAYLNLGHAHASSGNHDAARQAFLLAAENFSVTLPPGHSYRVDAAIQLAHIEARDGDSDAAEHLAIEAIDELISLYGDEYPELGKMWQKLAYIRYLGGDFDGAEEASLASLEIRQAVGSDFDPVLGENFLLLGQVHRSRGEFEEAMGRFAQAVEVLEQSSWYYLLVVTTAEAADLALGRGDVEDAAAWLGRATAAFESARMNQEPGLGRATFARSPYELLAAVKAELGQPGEAWVAAEKARGRILHEQMQLSDRRDGEGADGAQLETLADREQLLRNRLDSLADSNDRPLVRETQSELLAVQAELGRLRATAVERSVYSGDTSFEVERIQATLYADEALIGWLVPTSNSVAGELWMWIVRDRGPVRWIRASKAAENTSAMREELYGATRAPFTPGTERARTLGTHLWKSLFARAIEAKALQDIQHLIVVPSGPILGLPIECLFTGEGDYAADRWSFSYAPSGTIHTILAERDAVTGRGQRPALFVADPPFGVEGGARNWRSLTSETELARLTETRTEVKAIAPLFKEARVLLDKDADERTIQALRDAGELPKLGLLHFATHALIDDRAPLRSGLLLNQLDLPDALEAAINDERPVDGILTAGEVAASWRLDADLVTLSACSTGLGRAVPGEGYIGFAQAFLQAGARSLVVSLWDVEDRATAIFMQAFYQRWLSGKPSTRAKADALAHARRTLRDFSPDGKTRPYAHPTFWSAFVLIGDPR